MSQYTSKHTTIGSGRILLRLCTENPASDVVYHMSLTPANKPSISNVSCGSITHNKTTGYLDGKIVTCIDNTLNYNNYTL